MIKKYSGIFAITLSVLFANVNRIVYRDFNLNGSKDINEVGIPNITVKLNDNNGNEIGVTQTCNDGNYSINADSSKK